MNASLVVSMVNKQFRIAESLYQQKPLGINPDLILFPLGTANCPPANNNPGLHRLMADKINGHFGNEFRLFLQRRDNVLPVIIYPLLEKAWTVSQKPPAAHVDSYLLQLKDAVTWLNAGSISHNDLLPRNILFRLVAGKIEIKIIDFEFSTFFHEELPEDFLQRSDRRYPFCPERGVKPDSSVVGQAEFNNFFFLAIKEFVNQQAVGGFTDFMKSYNKSYTFPTKENKLSSEKEETEK
jgi:hypothetical protein